jgi:hypothetical protein
MARARPNIAVSATKGFVHVTFGEGTVEWLALLPEQAEVFASALSHYAAEARRGR